MSTDQQQRLSYPRAGMCLTCAKRDDDCSSLPFHAMPVICIYPDAVCVRCTEHVPAKPSTGETA
jgi:hypothetical protein